MRPVCLICLVFWVAACDDGGGGTPTATDSTTRTDAAEVDAAIDAAPVDLAPPADARPRDAAPADASAPDAAPDAAPPPPETPLCGACASDRDCPDPSLCTRLLDGASYCLSPCANGAGCTPGYTCLGDRCLPAGARCDSCTVTGCVGDLRCNLFTGACEPKAGRCGACQADVDCSADLRCTPLGFGASCLAVCQNGMCPGGFRCQGGTCVPESGACDACGGCGGQTPVCDFLAGQCVACGNGVACPAGQICAQGACVPPGPGVECNSNLDCQQQPGRPFCEVDRLRCVACLEDAACPAGTLCRDGACAAADACRGIACQTGTACANGICRTDEGAPGCMDDAGCPGDGRHCNPLTGQCFRADQRCDDQNVCAPGGLCRGDPFDANQTVCTCLKTDPADFMEANDRHRIPCQPGGTCLQFGPDPGACIAAPAP